MLKKCIDARCLRRSNTEAAQRVDVMIDFALDQSGDIFGRLQA